MMVSFRECFDRFTRRITRWPHFRPDDSPVTIMRTALHHYAGLNSLTRRATDRTRLAILTILSVSSGQTARECSIKPARRHVP